MKTPRPKTLLIVEDEANLAASLLAASEAMGYIAWTCATAAEALNLAKTCKPTLIISDVHLSKGDGRAVLAGLRADPALRDSQFVLMTGDWVGASRQASIEGQADDYLPKPFTMQELTACINERYRQANL